MKLPQQLALGGLVVSSRKCPQPRHTGRQDALGETVGHPFQVLPRNTEQFTEFLWTAVRGQDHPHIYRYLYSTNTTVQDTRFVGDTNTLAYMTCHASTWLTSGIAIGIRLTHSALERKIIK